MIKRLTIIVLVAAIALRCDSSFACSTCFGAEGNPQTEGLNAAIITLLSVTYTLFSCMALAAFLYWKKNRILPVDENGDDPSPRIEEAPTHNG
jgi:hypothetical protein